MARTEMGIPRRVVDSISCHSGIHLRGNERFGHRNTDNLVERAEKIAGWIINWEGERILLMGRTFMAIWMILNFFKSERVRY